MDLNNLIKVVSFLLCMCYHVHVHFIHFINCRAHVTLESKICFMADLNKHSLQRKYLKQKVIGFHKLLTLTQSAVSIFRVEKISSLCLLQ